MGKLKLTCIIVFLILGVFAGVLLVRQQQNISEKAQEALCPAAEACPVSGQPDLLRNCSSVNEGDSPQEVSCSNIGNVGQTAQCGTLSFCCPSLGASWTTDIMLCMTPTPTPVPTPTPTPTETPSATPTPIATGSPTPIASGTPNSCGGTCGSNSNCGSGFYCYTSVGLCRNPSCPTEADCNCPTTSPSSGTTAPGATPAPSLPVSGTDWPTIFGAGIGLFVIIGSLLLAL